MKVNYECNGITDVIDKSVFFDCFTEHCIERCICRPSLFPLKVGMDVVKVPQNKTAESDILGGVAGFLPGNESKVNKKI